MAKFDDIIPLIKRHEGGLTGDPRDISAAANPSPCGCLLYTSDAADE